MCCKTCIEEKTEEYRQPNIQLWAEYTTFSNIQSGKMIQTIEFILVLPSIIRCSYKMNTVLGATVCPKPKNQLMFVGSWRHRIITNVMKQSSSVTGFVRAWNSVINDAKMMNVQKRLNLWPNVPDAKLLEFFHLGYFEEQGWQVGTKKCQNIDHLKQTLRSNWTKIPQNYLWASCDVFIGCFKDISISRLQGDQIKNHSYFIEKNILTKRFNFGSWIIKL